MAIVIDASIAIGWVVPTQATELTKAVLSFVEIESGWVPPHFAIEILRTLRKHERRGLMPPEHVDAAIALLQKQPLSQDQTDAVDCIDTVVSLARRYALRVADAAYLELSMRLKLPLATRDTALARAAQQAGATVFSV